MATLFITSTVNKAKAEHLLQRIEDGTLPKPPALQGKANECARCHKMTMFARFHIPQVGYGCEACFDDWRTTPVWCDTRADQVHRGRFHIIPQCVIDAEVKQSAPQTPQDAPQACVYVWDAKRSEEAWTTARKEGEAKRGNVMIMPWVSAA